MGRGGGCPGGGGNAKALGERSRQEWGHSSDQLRFGQVPGPEVTIVPKATISSLGCLRLLEHKKGRRGGGEEGGVRKARRVSCVPAPVCALGLPPRIPRPVLPRLLPCPFPEVLTLCLTATARLLEPSPSRPTLANSLAPLAPSAADRNRSGTQPGRQDS